MSNRKIEDSIVDKLKASAIGEFIDEGDLYDICKRAIDRAFFFERTVQDGSYRTKQLPAPIVEMAKETFTEQFRLLAEPIIADLLKDEAFVKSLIDVMVQVLPSIMMTHATSMAHQTSVLGAQMAVNRVQELAEQHLLGSPGVRFKLQELI